MRRPTRWDDTFLYSAWFVYVDRVFMGTVYAESLDEAERRAHLTFPHWSGHYEVVRLKE